jgi:hypothetical protein
MCWRFHLRISTFGKLGKTWVDNATMYVDQERAIFLSSPTTVQNSTLVIVSGKSTVYNYQQSVIMPPASARWYTPGTYYAQSRIPFWFNFTFDPNRYLNLNLDPCTRYSSQSLFSIWIPISILRLDLDPYTWSWSWSPSSILILNSILDPYLDLYPQSRSLSQCWSISSIMIPISSSKKFSLSLFLSLIPLLFSFFYPDFSRLEFSFPTARDWDRDRDQRKGLRSRIVIENEDGEQGWWLRLRMGIEIDNGNGWESR